MTRKEISIPDISHKNMADLIHIACIFDSDTYSKTAIHESMPKALWG